LDSNIVESPANIQFSEVLGTPELVHEFRNERKWVFVLYRHLVQHLVVLYEPKRAILKKTGDAMGDFDCQMRPVSRFSVKKWSSSFCSVADSG
jgi:hypothetical protein